MKKIPLLVGMLFISVSLFASPIGEKRAREIAEDFFIYNTTRSSSVEVALEWAGDDIVEQGQINRDRLDEAMLYIYNRKDMAGFVVIAGDNTLNPIVAYSFNNSIDVCDMAPATRAILSAWGRQVAVSRRVAKPITRADDSSIGTVVREYETALWNQGEPYNREAPEYNGERSVTGCVATAMSIIAYYHKYPKKGVGTTPAYTNEYINAIVPANTLGREYDYDNMLSNYNNGYNDTQANAVAALMKDMGTAVQMNYSPDASGAYSDNIPYAMSTYFGYSKQTTHIAQGGYSGKEWIAMLKENIDEYGPTLYNGVGDAGGHQFVVTGYTNKDYFAFNFGWGGYGNGYFKLPDIEFYMGQGAVFYLEPDPEGTSTYRDNLSLITLGNYQNSIFVPIYKGIVVNSSNITSGVEFQCLIGGIRNGGMQAFSGDVALALCDSNGAIKETLYSVSTTIERGNYIYGDLNITINSAIADDDRLRICYKGSTSSEWQWARAGDDMCVCEIILKSSPAQIADMMSLQYTIASKTLTIGAPIALQYSVKNSSNTIVVQGSVVAGERSDIDLSECVSGVYTLSVSSGSDPYVVTLRL